MNQTEIDRTIKLAPVLRELFCESEPNYKLVSLALLQLAGLETLGLILQERKQDWKSISESLVETVDFTSLYQRCTKIVGAIRKNPALSYAEISTITGYSVTTVRQTINSLSKGGLKLNQMTAPTKNGRPKTLHLIERWKL